MFARALTPDRESGPRRRPARLRMLAATAAAVASIPLLAGAASARPPQWSHGRGGSWTPPPPPPPSTVTLQCDSAVDNGTATVQLVTSTADATSQSAPVTLSCGQSATLQPSSSSATAYTWSTSFSMWSGTFSGSGTADRGQTAAVYDCTGTVAATVRAS